MTNPFLVETEARFVAIRGLRCGYVQLAPRAEVTAYAGLPDEFFRAAKAWAAHLETGGAERVYWITLSEVVRHLHIHLYPRWLEDGDKGLPLFEQRNTPSQPAWRTEILSDLSDWAKAYDVHLIQQEAGSIMETVARVGAPNLSQ